MGRQYRITSFGLDPADDCKCKTFAVESLEMVPEKFDKSGMQISPAHPKTISTHVPYSWLSPAKEEKAEKPEPKTPQPAHPSHSPTQHSTK